jgi:hypothetical protein
MENLSPENFFLIFQVFMKLLIIWSPLIVGVGLYVHFMRPKRITQRNKRRYYNESR